ncbi:hypothetical protein [Bradyrhizobium sp. NFR13]|uniref:hypothetical protein n=1 Tax=Bradyrhizobium sp. NFR13 TaxID=1566285 RepID=UPI0011139339|nr:hypothetical protein [Bradyrhizobium sp. NFR13]
MIKMLRPPDPIPQYETKPLNELKREALSVRRPMWPYPGGPTDRPENAGNLRGPDGVVRAIEHDGPMRDAAKRLQQKVMSPSNNDQMFPACKPSE